MIETLYKTEMPEKEISECYVLVLTSRTASGRKFYLFMEEHGRWDEVSKRFNREVSSINTEEETTYEDALGMYNTARRKLAQLGFIHSFVPDSRRKGPHAYRLFEPESVSA
jgi:hypothetical protein